MNSRFYAFDFRSTSSHSINCDHQVDRRSLSLLNVVKRSKSIVYR